MPTVKQLLTEAKKLSADKRRQLANQIMESVPSPFDDPEIEAAWAEEIKKRVADIGSGRSKFYSWKQVEKELDRIVDKSRVSINSSSRSARNGRGSSVVRRSKSTNGRTPAK